MVNFWFYKMENKYIKGRKIAFTLAEILITLAIVGVVASMTMPTLIKHYQQKQTVEQLKRVYSQLSNAVVQSQDTNGDYRQWDLTLSAQDFFLTYLKDYLPIIQECKPSNKSCSKVTNRVDLKGDTTNLNTINAYKAYSVVLNNGTILWSTKWDHYGPIFLFIVDINGDKGPNRNGRDVFGFSFTKDGLHGYSFDPYRPTWRYNTSGYGGCNKNACCAWMGAGGGCSQMIIYDGWKISKDYPW